MKKIFVMFAVISLAALLLAPICSAADMPDGTVTGNVTSTAPMPGDSYSPTVNSKPSGAISPALSPALDIIAANSGMAKSGLTGKDISFSEDDFARAMNLARIDSLTVVSLPDVSDGILMLGNTAVAKGQTVSRANLSLLRFAPSSEAAGVASFELSVNGAEYVIPCSLYMLTGYNANPTVSVATSTSLNMGGYESTALFGKLDAHDPEGDRLTYRVVSAPEHGLVIMNDRHAGEYTYLPEQGFTGKDSFTYVVCDKYGNYSASAKVNLSIATPATSVVYSDMKGHESACAAISMTEQGIMNGTQVGELCYFYPESEVSRVEFLVMAMNAAGIRDLPTVGSTGFYDDGQIPVTARPYVAAAKQLGYIKGSTDAQGNLCFNPNEKITRAEAALTVDSIIGGKSYLGEGGVTPVFSDSSAIPAWAQSSVETLNRLGIMPDDGGRMNASANITRGQTAVMLNFMMQVIDK